MKSQDLLRILRPGIFTSLQDLGRTGFRHLAIPKSGSLDKHSARMANFSVGNEESAPLLEIIGGQFQAECLTSLTLGFCGCHCRVLLNEIPIKNIGKILVSKGDRLSIQGELSYLALGASVDGDSHFNSISTYAIAKLGGIRGGLIQKDDVLTGLVHNLSGRQIPADLYPKKQNVIRVLKGPEYQEIHSSFEDHEWGITSASNRIGLRLEGSPLKLAGTEMAPVPVFPGTIQLPSDGQPIILLADAQTTGGYPRIAQVINADLSATARLICGGRIKFKFVEIDEARKIFNRQQAFITHALNHSDS